MERIAVVGTGVIGTMMGGFLARGGYDVTMISQFRRDMAETLTEKGVTVIFGEERFHAAVKAAFAGDLGEESFDIVLLTGKSNDTEAAVRLMLEHLSPEGYFCSMQNGMNETVLIPMAGADRVLPCVCFAGGQSPEPGTVVTHDGYFIIGELDGSDTPRLRRLGEILGCAKRVELTHDIMKARWKKLAEVCITVPCACVSGLPLFAGFDMPRMQRAFAALALEELRVAGAMGVEPDPIMGMTPEEWRRLLIGDGPLGERFAALNRMGPPEPKPGEAPRPAGPALKPADAYTQDIQRGRPLEIWYTNGWIEARGRELGVGTPAQSRVLELIRQIEAGQRRPGLDALDLIAESAK